MSMTSVPTRRSVLVRIVWPSVALMLFFAVTASIYVWWHYYICTNADAIGVRRFYTYQSSVPGKGHPGYFDWLLPACLMGFVTGLAGSRLTPRWTVVHVLLIAVGLTLLQPMFARWVPADELWWMPADWKWPLATTFKEWFFICLYCAVFAYLGRLYGQRWWGLGDNPEPCG
jgi:hypothetical protein